MKVSQFPLATVKETPADAEIVSHQLMMRAGMIRNIAAGIYSWQPLGLRILRKAEAVVREEMNRAGGLELLMPAIQPSELWEESQRWESRYSAHHLRADISRQDSEELWDLLESAGAFSFNPNLYPFGRIDGLDRNLQIVAGPIALRVDSWAGTQQDLPMYRLKRRLLAWLRGKGLSEPANLFPLYCTEDEYVRAVLGISDPGDP